MPHEIIVFVLFVFPLAPIEPLYDLNVIFPYGWATFYFIYLMSNIISEIFVGDHVQQVSTSVRRHCVTYYTTLAILSKHNGVGKYFRFLKGVFYCYDSASFYRFVSGTECLGDFWSFFSFMESLRT